MLIQLQDVKRIDIPWELGEMMIHGQDFVLHFHNGSTWEIFEAIKEWEGGTFHINLEDRTLVISEQTMPKVQERIFEIEDTHEKLDKGFNEFVGEPEGIDVPNSLLTEDQIQTSNSKDNAEIRRRVREARRRSPIIDQSFRIIREREDLDLLRGSDYVRALELAVVKLEEVHREIRQKYEDTLNTTQH